MSCSAAAMKIWAPPFWQSGSSLIWNKAGMFVKVYLTVSNLAYVEKKARGRLTAPACLSTCFKMVSAFFRGEPLGYPWEGGCVIWYFCVFEDRKEAHTVPDAPMSKPKSIVIPLLATF